MTPDQFEILLFVLILFGIVAAGLAFWAIVAFFTWVTKKR